MSCCKRKLIAGGCVLLIAGWLPACKDGTVQSTNTPPDSPSPVVTTPVSVNPYEEVDMSPLDVSYFPTHYPQRKMSGRLNTNPVMRVFYSRPHLQGRKLLPDILKYNEPWRLGANEATELDIFQTIYLNDKKIQPGRYTLYCVPKENEWQIILNTNLDVWGLQPDRTKDIQSINVPVTVQPQRVEYFTMVFKKSDKGADLLIAWDNLLAKVPFVINK